MNHHQLEQVLTQADKLLEGGELVCVRAPGRVNLIGEHTDYNQGLVVPGAIDRYMYFAAKPRAGQVIRATAVDTGETISIDLTDLKKTSLLWGDFLVGILLQLEKRGFQLSGFDCMLTSEVPIGAGMSSSAALECAFLVGLRELFGLQLSRWDLIDISQASNHEFLGVKGGILDQFASLYGKKDEIMVLDCDSRDYRYWSIPSSNYTWLLINTCVKHNHVTSGYNDRVRECQQALADIQKVYPATPHLSAIAKLEDIADVQFSSETAQKRANYIIAENQRVRDFTERLSQGDFVACGELLYASHQGLSELYEVSCPELDFMVNSIREVEGVLGSRMMGGGFGGCTINLVHKDSVDTIKTVIDADYKATFGMEAEYYPVAISDGAGRVEVL